MKKEKKTGKFSFRCNCSLKVKILIPSFIIICFLVGIAALSFRNFHSLGNTVSEIITSSEKTLMSETRLTVLIGQIQQTSGRYFYFHQEQDKEEAKSTIAELKSLETIASEDKVMAALVRLEQLIDAAGVRFETLDKQQKNSLALVKEIRDSLASSGTPEKASEILGIIDQVNADMRSPNPDAKAAIEQSFEKALQGLPQDLKYNI